MTEIEPTQLDDAIDYPDQAMFWWQKIDTDLVLTLVLIFNAIISTFISYQGSTSGGDSDWENTLGAQAARNAAEVQSDSYAQAYQHYRAFTRYAVNNGLVFLYDQEIAEAQAEGDNETVRDLQVKRSEAEQIALDNRAFFPAKYLNLDGTYNIERELNELWAEQALQKDIYPDPHFSQADELGKIARRLNRPSYFISSLIYLLFSLAYAINPERSQKLRLALTGLNVATLMVMVGWYLVELL